MGVSQQTSPEDIERMKRLFEQLEAGFEPPDGSIRALREAHRELSLSLKEFEPNSAIRLISCLETFPELQENTIRIEVLLHLAVCCCNGDNEATSDVLRQWIRLLDESPMGSQEDPAEDVFVGYVCTRDGGFRVYPGISSNADFILERLLFFLAGKTDFPGFGEVYASVLELLKVSEAMAQALGQARYCVGDSRPGDPIQVPADDLLNVHSIAVFFDRERLSRLGIDPGRLQVFCFDGEQRAEFGSEPLFGSHLESHPLIAVDGGFLVASPTSLCRAGAVRILQVTANLGGWADTFFGTESATHFVDDIIRGLGIQPIGGMNLPSSPGTLPPFYLRVGQFDYGMPALALTWSSSLTEGSDLEGVDGFTGEQVADFTRYIGNCCAACEGVEGFKGGLVLLALSSVGRPVGIALRELRPNWRLFAASLADWQTLAIDPDFRAKRLWYLGLQEQIAEESNVQIVNTAGLLNLYAFWKEQGFVLLDPGLNPRNPRNMLMIGGTPSQALNASLKSGKDRHCRISHDGTHWVILQRQGPGLNPDLSNNLTYCDYGAARNGLLSGCVEHGKCAWWVEVNPRPASPASRNLLYRLWDCVFNWMERLVPVLITEHPDWTPERLKIEFDFPGIEGWRAWDIAEFSGPPAALSFCAYGELAVVRMTIAEGFLVKFFRPDNIAEQEIVFTVIQAAAEIAKAGLSEAELKAVVSRVTKNEKGRFFHIVRSPTLESALGGPESAAPALIPAEEIARVRSGLAYLASDKPPRQIANLKEAQGFLDIIVQKLHADLSARLKHLQILPVVSYSFAQLDEISRDSSRWGLSTRSLLALEDGADWLRNRLRLENARLALAEIANRALIETAVYSFNPEATEFITQTEHATLLAQFAVMIELANHRDAIVGGFVGPNLTIHPNGTIDYDDAFQHDVFQPYLTSRIDDHIQWDADAYESNFEMPNINADSSHGKTPEAAAFEEVFEAEFGFPYETLARVISFFDKRAFSTGRTGGTLESLEFRSLLKQAVGLTDRQVDSFIERFTLPIRPQWDKKLPKGCERNDVLPWRFFRGLSVLVRPFVEVGRSPRCFAISVPHLHRWMRYLTLGILEGHLPERLFQSPAMKSYLGRIASKKGHEFAKKVASLMQNLLPDQRVEIKLTALGAPADPDLGDVDVLSWDRDTGIVFLIECKRLKPTLTVSQAIQQLEEFRGDPAEKDSLAKHRRRLDWLQANPREVSKITGLAADNIRWVPLLVTSGRVPMSFVNATGFPKEQVVPAQELESHISGLLPRGCPSTVLSR